MSGSANAPDGMRPVPFATGYFVTEDGRVFSEYRLSMRQLRCSKHPSGYKRVRLFSDARPLRVSVHRLMALVFHGSPPSPASVVRHLDGNPQNNRAENLAWGTHAENSADMIRHGRSMAGPRNWHAIHPEAYPVGEAHYRAKITADDVRAIRAEAARDNGRGHRRLAAAYGITRKAVFNIIHRRSWKSVP